MTFKNNPVYFTRNLCKAMMASLIVSIIPSTVVAESSSENWGAFAAGGFSTFVILSVLVT